MARTAHRAAPVPKHSLPPCIHSAVPPTQTLNYLPYGEDWVDIQNYADTRYPRLGIYTYNGKEKDYESGFHYYGARYYWSEVQTDYLRFNLEYIYHFMC